MVIAIKFDLNGAGEGVISKDEVAKELLIMLRKEVVGWKVWAGGWKFEIDWVR